MADNVPVTPGTGATIATDDVAGVQFQKVKLDLGGDGSSSPLIRGQQAATDSLPVVLASDQGAVPVGDGGGSITVDGTVAVSGTVAVTQSGVWDEVGINDSGNVISVDDAGSTLSVDDGAGSLTVDGSVTANAGTNLNTSALALEAGGNLAASATSLAIIDDWDESDRAKTNPIVGQAGVQGGSGLVSALTQRVVLATDIALPAGANAIGKLAANSGVDIGDVDVTSVPADPFGANGDAASATGSISAKLRFIAGTGIPITGTVTVASHAVTNAGTFAVQAAQAGTWNIATLTGITNVVHVDDNSSTLSIDDGGGAITVDGTVAVTLAAGAAAPAKAEDVASADADVGIPAMAVRKATPANTSGTDGDYEMLQMSAGRLWVDASGVTLTVASHAVTNAGTFAVQSTLQAGDAVVGRVKLTDGTDVADILDLSNSNPLTVAIVDGSGDQITSFGGGTQYTEDAAAAANPVGNALIAVRDDSRGGSLTSTDGDNVALRGTNAGELYVKHVDSITVLAHAVTNAGTFAVQVDGSALTSLQLIDDVVYTDDTSTHSTGTSKGVLLMAAATPTDSAVNANDIGAVAMTTDRKLHVSVQDALPAGSAAIGKLAANDGVDIGDVTINNASLTVISGTAANLKAEVVGTGTFAVQATIAAGAAAIAKAEDVASVDADVGVPAMVVRKATPANSSGTDGDYEFLQADGGKLWVQNVGFATTISTSFTRPSDTTTYAANDNMDVTGAGGTSGGLTLTGAARVSGGSGIITDIIVTSSADPAAPLQGELWIFDSALSANQTDNAAFALADADVLLLVAVVPFTLATTVAGSGTNSFAHIQNLSIGFTCVGTANLRYKVKAKNAYVPISGEVIQVRAKIVQLN